MTNYNKTCMDDLSIAVPIFEGAEEQDVVGPLERAFCPCIKRMSLHLNRSKTVDFGQANSHIDAIGKSMT
jgi:hypothetical protein